MKAFKALIFSVRPGLGREGFNSQLDNQKL